MSSKVSSAALEVLEQMTFQETSAHLPGRELPRELYEEVDEIMRRFRGKYVSRSKGYVFPYNPQPLILEVIQTGEMPPDNPHDFYPTPTAVIDQMMMMCPFSDNEIEGYRLLEPSAGIGGLAERMREQWPLAHLDTVEIQKYNARILRDKGFSPHEGDFLSFRPGAPYDLIMMNPPFADYQEHIYHAYELLKQGGILISVVPVSWRHDRESRFFRFVCDYGYPWWELPAGSFRESGTGIQTELIHLAKQESPWKSNTHCGWVSWRAWIVGLYLYQDRKWVDRLNRVLDGLPTDMFGYPTGDGRELLDPIIDQVVKYANDEQHEGVYLTPRDRAALYAYITDSPQP